MVTKVYDVLAQNNAVPVKPRSRWHGDTDFRLCCLRVNLDKIHEIKNSVVSVVIHGILSDSNRKCNSSCDFHLHQQWLQC